MHTGWYAFLAVFAVGADDVLVRFGTTTDPLKRLADLTTDAPFPLVECRYVPAGDRSIAASLDRALTDRLADLTTQGHWLRCSLALFDTLPAITLALLGGLTGTDPTWTPCPAAVLASYRERCSIAKARKPLRGFVTPSFDASQIPALDALRAERAEQRRADPAAIEQVRAILADGRCLSLRRLADLVHPPVKPESISAMLSRHPDFHVIDGLGWVLTAAQALERQRADLA